jgi:1-acyl-sn-glycerol-3-phosphate acyltransferase
MNAADWYWLGITPEATRSYRPNWKSGFYHLALAAKVPLCLVYIDYPNKTLGVRDHVFLSGDQEADMAAIRAGFAGHQGLHPEKAAPIVLSERKPD